MAPGCILPSVADDAGSCKGLEEITKKGEGEGSEQLGKDLLTAAMEIEEKLTQKHPEQKQLEQEQQKASPEEGSSRDRSKGGYDKLETKLEDAISSGKMNMKTPLSQKFVALHKPGTPAGDAYQSLKTHVEREQFRIKWAQKAYQDCVASKVHEKTYQKVDRTKGTYLPLSMIVQSEGGKDDPESLSAAEKYCLKCVAMGGEWCSLNSMTERMEYLYLRRESMDEMKEAWSEYEKESMNFKRPPEKRRQKSTADEETPGAPPEEGQPPAKVPKVRTKLEELVSKATKLKANFHSCIGAANALLSNISNDPSWTWARNPENSGVLQEHLKGMQKELSTFAASFLALDLKDVKAAHSKENLTVGLEEFIGNIDPEVCKIQEAMRSLLSMQSSRFKIAPVVKA